MTAIFFSRAIGPVPVACLLREGHQSTLGITENPVESGAKITDHAYLEPKRLTLEFADDAAAETYNALVRFQESRTPFDIVSGLYLYKSMLIRSITADRDEKYGKILKGCAELQEVIIVETATTRGSRRGASTSKGKAGDAATKDRASGPVERGDSPTKTVPALENKSLLKSMF